jgi:hypothetical protein
LEQSYNREIGRRIEVSEKLNIGIDTALAYSLITKHTPVIAATLLATAERAEELLSSDVSRMERVCRFCILHFG